MFHNTLKIPHKTLMTLAIKAKLHTILEHPKIFDCIQIIKIKLTFI